MSTGAQIVVVGIGADGWPGLSQQARDAILSADEVIGSARQLDLLPDEAPQARTWPSPIGALIDELVAREDGTVCVLASGDPMLHGIGATLAGRLPGGRLAVFSHPSAFSLACARMGWPAAEVELVSAVARPADVVARVLQPGRRVVVYGTGADGAARVARVLCGGGYGASAFVVMEQLGAQTESVIESSASGWGDRPVDPLHSIAIECVRDLDHPLLALVPGLPDRAYESDGALSKRHVRAATLAALAPTPGSVLWDIGAGSGSIAIEWLRAEPSARAIAVEAREDRAKRIARNATKLGVPALEVILGEAPGALAGLTAPDAVFIGGGLTTPGVLETAWEALATGGRIAGNAVTLEGEQALIAARAAHGGELVRIEVSLAEPIGAFTAWRPALPVVQWSSEKP
ncbi:MAG: precorrin-6y C5,15-methyltransferase (decarboxylating) subunit CbiE [Solirubrobacteraceae bacterium]